MSFETKYYTRKISQTKIFYEVVSTTDELSYVGKHPFYSHERAQEGVTKIEVLEPYRLLTPTELAIVKNLQSPVDDAEDVND